MAEANKKPKLYTANSPKGIAVFPRLNTPDTKFNANGVYSTKLVIAGEDATPLMAAIEGEADAAMATAREELEAKLANAAPKDKPKIKAALDKLGKGPLPFESEYDDQGEETGNVVFSFKTNATYKDRKTDEVKSKEVTMFAAKGKDPLKGKQRPNIWAGSTLKVNFTAAPYYNAATGSAGVSLRINAVQIINLVSSGGGNATTYGFGEEEGYEAPKASDESVFGDADEGTSEQGSGSTEDEADF